MEKMEIKLKMVFEELNFINRSKSSSIEDIKTHKKEIKEKLPILKGERENFWRNFHKAISPEEKAGIKERIDLVTDEINTLYGQRNACNRIIVTYNKVYEELQKEKEFKENFTKSMAKSKKEHNLR